MFSIKLIVALVTVSWTLAVPALAQQRVIELQVLTPPTAQAGTQQQWMRMLADVGVDRVSSSVRKIDRPSVDEQQFGRSTVVTVIGVLNNNRLMLPGRSFTRSDAAKLKRYFGQLRADGADLALASKQAFGLTADQLRDLREKLSQKVTGATAVQSARDAVEEISASAMLNLKISTAAQARLNLGEASSAPQNTDSPVGQATHSNELNGISVGTALAALLQPLELVVVPSRPQGGVVQLRVVLVAEAEEYWPIGWPLKDAPVIAAPRLFQREDIRIERFQLSKALPAISSRCDVPFFYDWLEISKAGVDLAATEVTFNRKRTSYRVTLSKLLRQADPPLAGELRLDENERPFFWITVRK